MLQHSLTVFLLQRSAEKFHIWRSLFGRAINYYNIKHMLPNVRGASGSDKEWLQLCCWGEFGRPPEQKNPHTQEVHSMDHQYELAMGKKNPSTRSRAKPVNILARQRSGSLFGDT